MERVLVLKIVGCLGLLVLFGLWENINESDGVSNLHDKLNTFVDDIGEELRDTLARIEGLVFSSEPEDKKDELLNPAELRMFVDELPDMPRLKGFDVINGAPKPKTLKIGMFMKKWKFHTDLPETSVFAYGTSKSTATIPGPTIEALHGVDTYVTWQNHLPSVHILPWDLTIPTAVPNKGIPTVVHLHGGIHEPESDGNSNSWFTTKFLEKGSTWTREKYHYTNNQQPGNLWYHDHAMGLTRVNLLAGLIGTYIIHHPNVEDPLGLPSGDEFDRPLMVFDRTFFTNGSIYMNYTGNNPSIHPQWKPEYFGDVVIVNGKAWPYMMVQRRRYRFRLINASNARFFRFFFPNGLKFIHVGSDSTYIEKPIMSNETLLAPSEIADVVIDFSKSKTRIAILANGGAEIFSPKDPINVVMKFIINKTFGVIDTSQVPKKLIKYPVPELSSALLTRYIAMYEYTSDSDEPTHLYLNGKSYEEPVTEIVKVGTSEVWNVINLTKDHHPFHIHLGLFIVLEQIKLLNIDEFKECMMKKNDAIKCQINKYAQGKKLDVPKHEKGWKNVYTIVPGCMAKILVRFSYIHSNESYSFDATAEPGYIYHCHILDHEDNVMMRPLKLVN